MFKATRRSPNRKRRIKAQAQMKRATMKNLRMSLRKKCLGQSKLSKLKTMKSHKKKIANLYPWSRVNLRRSKKKTPSIKMTVMPTASTSSAKPTKWQTTTSPSVGFLTLWTSTNWKTCSKAGNRNQATAKTGVRLSEAPSRRADKPLDCPRLTEIVMYLPSRSRQSQTTYIRRTIKTWISPSLLSYRGSKQQMSWLKFISKRSLSVSRRHLKWYRKRCNSRSKRWRERKRIQIWSPEPS